MFLRRLFLCVGLGSACACARPTLDELSDAGEVMPAPEEDARVASRPDTGSGSREDAGGPVAERDTGTKSEPEPEPDDAGQTEPEDAGSCSDGDGDSVCDTDDNCPDIANERQEDADEDGRGDACPRVAANCEGADVQNNVTVGSATVGRVRINDAEGTVARVAPGAQIELSVLVRFSTCEMVMPQQLYVGLESTTATCQPALCNQAFETPLPFRFSIVAPTEPGLHYVLAGLGATFSCSTSGPIETRIAALCVDPP